MASMNTQNYGDRPQRSHNKPSRYSDKGNNGEDQDPSKGQRRTIFDPDANPKGHRCERCTATKQRCSGGYPCGRCRKAGGDIMASCRDPDPSSLGPSAHQRGGAALQQQANQFEYFVLQDRPAGYKSESEHSEEEPEDQVPRIRLLDPAFGDGQKFDAMNSWHFPCHENLANGTKCGGQPCRKCECGGHDKPFWVCYDCHHSQTSNNDKKDKDNVMDFAEFLCVRCTHERKVKPYYQKWGGEGKKTFKNRNGPGWEMDETRKARCECIRALEDMWSCNEHRQFMIRKFLELGHQKMDLRGPNKQCPSCLTEDGKPHKDGIICVIGNTMWECPVCDVLVGVMEGLA